MGMECAPFVPWETSPLSLVQVCLVSRVTVPAPGEAASCSSGDEFEKGLSCFPFPKLHFRAYKNEKQS